MTQGSVSAPAHGGRSRLKPDPGAGPPARLLERQERRRSRRGQGWRAAGCHTAVPECGTTLPGPQGNEEKQASNVEDRRTRHFLRVRYLGPVGLRRNEAAIDLARSRAKGKRSWERTVSVFVFANAIGR